MTSNESPAASSAREARGIAVVAGHMFRGSEMDAEAQATADALIREQAHSLLVSRGIGQVFGALACGADIVVAEAAASLGIPFHAVLPFPPRYFAESSVDLGDTKGVVPWRPRFDAMLLRAASLTLADDARPRTLDLDGHFYFGFRFMAGLALIRARELATECRLIAVVDGATAASVAGASRSVEDWLAAKRPLDVIAFPFPRRAVAGGAQSVSAFRPVVFVRDMAGAGAETEITDRLRGVSEFVRAPPDARPGAGSALVAPSIEGAIRLGEAAVRGPAGRAVRVIVDFGPVLGAAGRPDGTMIARLGPKSEMPGLPTGRRPLAMLAFAAQAIAELGPRLELRPIGPGEIHGSRRRRADYPIYRFRLRRQRPA